ncbi:MAG: GNAT family N-acetyltransferase, partial [Phaeodactylibacter sp.]|nr:GNAT family N-acetyltransferase [Phaeodactylibacter sp.]
MTLQSIPHAHLLPDAWDRLADSVFQRKHFLDYCESYNPCNQRYYCLLEKETLLAGAVVYTLKINLFTFSNLRSVFKMQVIGLPVSVSAGGMIGTPSHQEILIKKILEQERGLIVGLNLDPELDTQPGVGMPLLPNLEMPVEFESWSDYLGQLRAPYRRRALRITEKFREVRQVHSACSEFSATHYALYLAIMDRTPSKLEILSQDFFQQLPPEFQLSTSYQGEEMLCWHITCRAPERLYFFFGGNNYDQMEEYQSYFNNLFLILKRACAEQAGYLDLGQTAEIPKMRLGGRLIPKQLFLYHRFALIRWLFKKLKRQIGYTTTFPAVHVFRTVQPLEV